MEDRVLARSKVVGNERVEQITPADGGIAFQSIRSPVARRR